MSISPASNSYKRGIRAQTVDLPPPELPTKAIFLPRGISKFTLFRTKRSPSYENLTFLNSILSLKPSKVFLPSPSLASYESSSKTSFTRSKANNELCTAM